MKPIKPIAWRNRGATIAGVVIWPTVRQRFIDPGELTDRTPSLAAQSKSPAPIDQQRLGALIRILRGTEDGARDWLAFGLDPFLAPSANTRARLLDAAEAHLRALARRLGQMDAATPGTAPGCPSCGANEFLAVAWMLDSHDTLTCTACGTECRRAVTSGAVVFEESPARVSSQTAEAPRLSDPLCGGAEL